MEKKEESKILSEITMKIAELATVITPFSKSGKSFNPVLAIGYCETIKSFFINRAESEIRRKEILALKDL